MKKRKKLFPRRKARPDQAGSVRRGLALLVDVAVIAGLGGVVTFLLGGPFASDALVTKTETGGFVLNLSDLSQTFNAVREGIFGYLYFIESCQKTPGFQAWG